MTNLSPAAQAVLCAYRDLSWTPDEEDNGKYYKFCHKAGMAAALRVVATQVTPVSTNLRQSKIRYELLAIATELEGTNG
jgi:hypothetical protein